MLGGGFCSNINDFYLVFFNLYENSLVFFFLERISVCLWVKFYECFIWII